jgi:hypothetical protein
MSYSYRADKRTISPKVRQQVASRKKRKREPGSEHLHRERQTVYSPPKRTQRQTKSTSTGRRPNSHLTDKRSDGAQLGDVSAMSAFGT